MSKVIKANEKINSVKLPLLSNKKDNKSKKTNSTFKTKEAIKSKEIKETKNQIKADNKVKLMNDINSKNNQRPISSLPHTKQNSKTMQNVNNTKINTNTNTKVKVIESPQKQLPIHTKQNASRLSKHSRQFSNQQPMHQNKNTITEGKELDTSKSKIVSFSKIGGTSRLDISNRTKIIGETEVENEEENYRNEMNSKLDALINNSSKNKKYKFTLENNDYEKKLYTKFKECNKKMSNNDLSDNKSKEENDKFELVEKSVLDKLRNENDSILKNINDIKERLKELNIKKFRELGELNCRKYLSDNQEKLKTENIKYNQSLNLQGNYLKTLNEKLRNEFAGVCNDRNSLYNAVVSILKDYDGDCVEEFISTYNAFNNESYIVNNKGDDENKIEKLLGKISLLEYQIEYEKAIKKEMEKKEKEKSIF